MTDMVEKVARAIYRRAETYPRYALAQMNGVLAEDLARAAMEALMDPTPGMLDLDGARFALAAYQTMLRLALGEGSENGR